MRYVLLNWLSKSNEAVRFFVNKQAFILIAILGAQPSYAATCPTKSELKLQPDGYFATANGWRSQYNHKGLGTAAIVFRLVTLTKDETGETKVNGCVYELRSGRTVRMTVLPPYPSTSEVPKGKHWQATSKSSRLTEYECTAWQSKTTPCEFALTYVASAPVSAGWNPFKHDRRGNSR